MTVANDDIRAVASQIIGICRRLGDGWTALATDMNAGADQREEAAQKAARLIGVADAMQEITDDSVEMVQRLATAEGKLAAIAKLIAEREQISLALLKTHFDDVVHHTKMVDDIKAILNQAAPA